MSEDMLIKKLVELLERATFVVESVAHLTGQEELMLPLADAARKAIAEARAFEATP